MDDVLPLCPLCSHPTDEPKLPCAACNATLPNAVQDWFHKAWFDGTLAELTHAEVGEALEMMRVACWLAEDPNCDVTEFLPDRRSWNHDAADLAQATRARTY